MVLILLVQSFVVQPWPSYTMLNKLTRTLYVPHAPLTRCDLYYSMHLMSCVFVGHV